MSTILFATIGTREVSIDSDTLDSILRPHSGQKDMFDAKGNPHCRFLGELLNQEAVYNEFRSAMSVPILGPVINYIAETIDKICLVVTNQDDEKYRKTDTIEFGKLITRLLVDKKWTQLSKKFSASQFFKMIEIRENVIYLDSQFEYFHTLLDKKNALNDFLGEAENIYLCAQGGIDAINTGLMLNLLNKYGDKVAIFNVNENGNCNVIRILPMIEKERLKKNAEVLASKYYYEAIETMEELPGNVRGLASYGKNRLLFNFSKAEKAIDNLDPSLHGYVDTLKSQVRFSKDSDLLHELYLNSHVKWEQQYYIDFLLRFFRIIEELCKSEILKVLEGFSFSRQCWDRDFESFLRTRPGLKNFLDNEKTQYGQVINYRQKNPTIEIFLAILKYFSSESPDKGTTFNERADAVYRFACKVKCLTQLRNNSIGAHSFDPVSREHIEEELKRSDPEYNPDKMFAELESILGCRENPFVELNKKITELLQAF